MRNIGAFGIIGIIFVICKAFEIGPIADWSWVWVLLPFWGGIALGLVVMLWIFVFAFIAAMIGAL